MRSVLASGLLLAISMHATDTLEIFGHQWTVPAATDWAVEKDGDAEVLRMVHPKPPEGPRRPVQYALSERTWGKVRIEADIKRIGKSLVIVYAWKDPTHFNYAHLSVDTAVQEPVHNGIFHVYGGDRVRISSTSGPGSLPSIGWHKVVLNYDPKTGEASVTVDGQTNSSLRGVDLSLGEGKVGLGSFGETGLFRNVRITALP